MPESWIQLGLRLGVNHEETGTTGLQVLRMVRCIFFLCLFVGFTFVIAQFHVPAPMKRVDATSL